MGLGMHLTVAASESGSELGSESGSESGPESGSGAEVGPVVVGPTPVPRPNPVLPNRTGGAGMEMKELEMNKGELALKLEG